MPSHHHSKWMHVHTITWPVYKPFCQTMFRMAICFQSFTVAQRPAKWIHLATEFQKHPTNVNIERTRQKDRDIAQSRVTRMPYNFINVNFQSDTRTKRNTVTYRLGSLSLSLYLCVFVGIDNKCTEWFIWFALLLLCFALLGFGWLDFMCVSRSLSLFISISFNNFDQTKWKQSHWWWEIHRSGGGNDGGGDNGI